MADFERLVALIESQSKLEAFSKAFKSSAAFKNAYDKDGNSLLHLATAKGHLDILQYLLDQNVSVAAANQEGQTALHMAAWTSNAAATRRLLDTITSMPGKAKAAVLNAKDKEHGRTAVHYAAKAGSDNIIKQLVQTGADANVLSTTKHTALRSAATHAHIAAVTELVSGGALVNLPVGAVNPLHAAASLGNMEVVTSLLAASDAAAAVKALDAKGSSVLHYAISSGKPSTQLVPLLETLMQHGADVNAADSQGMTVLHQAAKSCPCAVVEVLLAHGAAINTQDKTEGKTPLHFAAERGVQAAVKLLLEKGASAVLADQQGRLPQDLVSGKIHTLLMKEAVKQGGSSSLARDQPSSGLYTEAQPHQDPVLAFGHNPTSRGAMPSMQSQSYRSLILAVNGVIKKTPDTAVQDRAQSSPSASNRSNTSAGNSPFLDVTNTPTSKALAAATSASKIPKPSPLSQSRGPSASGLASQIPKFADSHAKSAGSRGSDGGGESRRRHSHSQGLEQLQLQLQDVIVGGKQMQEELLRSGSTAARSAVQRTPLPVAKGAEEHDQALNDVARALTEAKQGVHQVYQEQISELEQRLSRQQQALEEWKANDSIQVESARADIAKLKDQLKAQTESARVASAQCKSAQTELKAAKQQLAAQAKSAQAAQAESTQLESARRELAALREATQQHDESRARHVAELQGTVDELQNAVEKAEGAVTDARQESTALQAQVDSLSTQLQHSQAKQQQLVQEYEAKVATAADAERAIGRAMTTQVDSLRRQVADLEALQAENERLRKLSEAGQRDAQQHEQKHKALQQSLQQAQLQNSNLQQAFEDAQRAQQASASRAEALSTRSMQVNADKAAVESNLALKEDEASRLQHEAMYLRQQMQVLQAQAASMQEDAAVHSRSLQAANLELKAQRLKVKQLEDTAAQGPPPIAPELKAGINHDVDLSVLEAPHWKQDNLVDLQQKWVQSLQRIKDCCTAQPARSTQHN